MRDPDHHNTKHVNRILSCEQLASREIHQLYSRKVLEKKTAFIVHGKLHFFTFQRIFKTEHSSGEQTLLSQFYLLKKTKPVLKL